MESIHYKAAQAASPEVCASTALEAPPSSVHARCLGLRLWLWRSSCGALAWPMQGGEGRVGRVGPGAQAELQHSRGKRAAMGDGAEQLLDQKRGAARSAHAASCSSKRLSTLLDVCVSSLRRGHAHLLCIVPILSGDPREESDL